MSDYFAQFQVVGEGPEPEETEATEGTSNEYFFQFKQVATDPTSAESVAQEEVELNQEVADNLAGVPLQIGPWDTGVDMEDVIGDDATAAVVGLGAGLMDSYRGMKQLMGIDAEDEARNEEILNQLYQSEEYGTEALAGLIGGAIADPVGLAAGAGVSKAINVSRILSKASKVGKMAAEGAIVGGTQTGTGYIDEEGMLDRKDMILLGATIGGGLGYAGGKFQTNRADKAARKSIEQVEDLERAVGGLTKDGQMTIDDALVFIHENDPEILKRAMAASEKSGRVPDLVNAGKNYDLLQKAEVADMPLEAAVKAMPEGKGISNFDKLAGVISSQVKKLNPRVFGKLRRYDSNMSMRPEKYRKMRAEFADLFPTNTGRITKDVADQFSEADIQILNHHLLNEKFGEARKFIKLKRGQKALDAFDRSLKVYDELGDELISIGALDKKLDNYWHRSLDMSKKDEFMEVLKKDVAPDIQTRWEKKLKELEKKAVDRRGYGLTGYEEAQAFERFVFGGDPDMYSVGALKKRKIKNIPQEWVQYYTNPIESLDAYIHTAIAEAEKAKFFGKNVYKSGMTKPGDFNIDTTLDSWRASDMLKGMSQEDQDALVDIINLRFGRGMAEANNLTSNYKALVNMTLLGNPISAITQFGDLGVSMYKNGVMRTAKTLVKNVNDMVGGQGKRITIEDLGLEQRFQEFEDLAKARNASAAAKKLRDWQDNLFKWSGFSLVDRLGKEAMVNSALDKAVKLADDGSSGAYKAWSKKLRRTIGEADFIKLKNDLKAFSRNGGGKENMTDDIMAYVFSSLADVQPISKSEVPQMYLSSNLGKTMYTLKTFFIKQLDLIRNDVIREAAEGSKIQAGKALVAYSTLLGMMNLTADEVKELVSGKKNLSDLEEEIQAGSVGSLLKNIYGSTAKTFGFSGYTMRDIAREGATGYAQSLIPPAPLADELVKIALRAMFGEPENIIDEGIGRRLLGQVPLAGRISAERFMPRDEGGDALLGEPVLQEAEEDEPLPFENLIPDDEVEGFAEGGKVEKEEPKEEKPKMEKLEPGMYQDDDGKLFQITEKGELKDMKDVMASLKL